MKMALAEQCVGTFSPDAVPTDDPDPDRERRGGHIPSTPRVNLSNLVLFVAGGCKDRGLPAGAVTPSGRDEASSRGF